MQVQLRSTDEIAGVRDLGLAWVVGVHGQAAEIRVLVQEPNTSLVGATAQLLGSEPGERARNLLARETKRDGSLLTLDVGSADGVKVGDIYEMRDPKQRDIPLARALVRSVHANNSSAKVIDGATAAGQKDWVLGDREQGPRPRAIKVMLAPITGAGPQPTMARIRDALNAAKKLPGAAPLQIVVSKPVTAKPEQLHERLIQRAREHGADQLVWMPTECPDGPCVHAQHAVMPDKADPKLRPAPLLLPPKLGVNGMNDAQAVFGQVAYAAGIFDEASYHLRGWLGRERALAPTDALTRLAQAELALGQHERARIWLAPTAPRESGAPLKPDPLTTDLTRAEVACHDAEPGELAQLEASLEQQAKVSPTHRAAHLAVLLCNVETRMQRGGDPLQLDRQIEKGLTLSHELGDKSAHMTLQRYMGRSLGAQGRFAKADQRFAAALKLATAAKDRTMMARIGLDRAKVRERAGFPVQAERHARTALALFKALHDEQGLVDCIPVLVRLKRQLRGLKGAKILIDAERDNFRGPHLERASFALGQASAQLALDKGDLNDALAELTRLGAAAHKHKLVAEEAELQGMFAEYYLWSGQTRRARDLLGAYSRHIGDRPGPAQARVLLLSARFSLQEGDAVAARTLAARALRSHLAAGDDAGSAAAQLLRAEVEREFGDRATAEAHYDEAKRLFTKVQDTDGVYRVALGKAALLLWRGGASRARQLLPPIIKYFQGTDNSMMAFEATLMFEWANFEYARDSDRTLAALRALKQQAMKQKYARLEAEAQMLIACVYRKNSDHVVAGQELAVGQKLYSAIGRHAQRWPCEGGDVDGALAGPVLAAVTASPAAAK